MSLAVPMVRRLWGLIAPAHDGRSSLRLIATEPTAEQVAASSGVLLLTGILADDAHDMTLPIVEHFPRIDIFDGRTAADGIADIVFDPPFHVPPRKALPMAANNLVAATVSAEVVAGTLIATGVKVRVQQRALVGGVVAALAGATVQVTVIGD